MVESKRLMNETLGIWTIGHSNQSFDEFADLLERHRIESLVDIRRYPGSRKFPHFNQDNLSASLSDRSIEYHWLEELGGRRSNRSSQSSPNHAWRNKSFQNYADYMLTPKFRDAFAKLVRLARNSRSAIMCSESVYWRCHRRLVSDYMVASHGIVQHIFPSGDSKPHTLTPGSVVDSTDPVSVVYPGEPKLFE